MKRLNLLLCLLILLIAVAPVVSATNQGRAVWWELESVRMNDGSNLRMADMFASIKRPKNLMLRQGRFPSSGHDKDAFAPPLTVDNASVWIKNPDGEVSKANISPKNGTVVLDLPRDLNPGNLTGRYLIGIHLDAGVMDIDSDGTDESVHLYSNYFVRYYKEDGVKSENSNISFNDQDKIALEITPLIEKTKLKSAGCPVSGSMKADTKGVGYVRASGSQTPFKEYKMKVNYKGRPLANAEVAILSKSGWEKTVITDSEGVLSVTAPMTICSDGKMVKKTDMASNGSRFRREDKLLYMVAYKDVSTGEYHCATLPMSLRRMMMGGNYQGEWRSKSEGFGFWGIIGASIGILSITGSIYHKKRRNREAIFKSNKSQS
jgi:hypothetical protein